MRVARRHIDFRPVLMSVVDGNYSALYLVKRRGPIQLYAKEALYSHIMCDFVKSLDLFR